jgi:hypothetical protein
MPMNDAGGYRFSIVVSFKLIKFITRYRGNAVRPPIKDIKS